MYVLSIVVKLMNAVFLYIKNPYNTNPIDKKHMVLLSVNDDIKNSIIKLKVVQNFRIKIVNVIFFINMY